MMIDEVGKGALFGNVVIAAIILKDYVIIKDIANFKFLNEKKYVF